MREVGEYNKGAVYRTQVSVQKLITHLNGASQSMID